MQINYDTYQLDISMDDMGNIEAIKLAGSDVCLIDLLSPVTFTDIQNEVEAAIKYENDQNAISDYVAQMAHG